MKRFILCLSLFILPIVLFFVSAEFYCRYETTFGIKKRYLTHNLDSIQVFILGSSHTQNAVNPEYLKENTSNLAFGGQPMSIDYLLLKKYIDKLPQLATVLIEVSPHRFYDDLSPAAWNGHIYSNLYNIYYNVEPISIKNYSLVFSDYQFFSSIFFDYCNPKAYRYKLNKYGFTINDFNDWFLKLGYDSNKIKNSYVPQYHYIDSEYKKANDFFLENTIKLCTDKKIKIILFTTPFYQTFVDKIPEKDKINIKNLTDFYKAKFGVKYFDYSEDKRFNIHDFKNDNHLNPDGAKKFTLIIDSLLNAAD